MTPRGRAAFVISLLVSLAIDSICITMFRSKLARLIVCQKLCARCCQELASAIGSDFSGQC